MSKLWCLFLVGCAGAPAGMGPDGGSDDGAVVVDASPPSVSSWVGTNLAADLPRVDIAYQLQPFDTAPAQKTATGYPLAGISGKSQTDLGFVLPSGAYKVSYKGTGTLAISGIGKTSGAWTSTAGEQRNSIDIVGTPGDFGRFLTLTITNAPGQTVTDIHIYYPGFDYDSPTVFLPQLINLLKPFRALRFMDWESTNNSKLTNWADRPTAANFGQSAFGEPYEHLVELVNVTGRDMWVTVPELASDDFVHQQAKFLAANLDFGRIATARAQIGLTTPCQILVEDSNETWNQGFSAFATFLAAAKTDAAKYTGVYGGTYGPSWQSGNADLMKVGQYHADRLAKIAAIYRQELTTVGKADLVAPVLSGWAIGTAYSDVGLRFIKDHYGDPKTQIRYIAIAPYFGPVEAQTDTLAHLFPSMAADITGKATDFAEFHKLGAEYGLGIVAYEGGQGINGNANLPIKHLAQHDQRMYDAYKQFATQWKQTFGESLFMHFSLAGTPGVPEFVFQYGFWGSIGSVLEDPTQCGRNLPTLTGTEAVPTVIHHCPKYRALAEAVPN